MTGSLAGRTVFAGMIVAPWPAAECQLFSGRQGQDELQVGLQDGQRKVLAVTGVGLAADDDRAHAGHQRCPCSIADRGCRLQTVTLSGLVHRIHILGNGTSSGASPGLLLIVPSVRAALPRLSLGSLSI